MALQSRIPEFLRIVSALLFVALIGASQNVVAGQEQHQCRDYYVLESELPSGWNWGNTLGAFHQWWAAIPAWRHPWQHDATGQYCALGASPSPSPARNTHAGFR